MQGVLGCQAKPGITVDVLLRNHFAAYPIQDAVCTWCSMKWTLLEHQQSIKEGLHRALPPTNTNQQRSESHTDSAPQDHREPQPPCGPTAPDTAAHQGPELHCPECERGEAPEQQAQRAVSTCSADVQLLQGCARGPVLPVEAETGSRAQLPGQRCACGKAPMQQPQPGPCASSADARLLEGCLQGTCPLPEADVECMARRAGMRWVRRRGTLLARSLIARAPQVRAGLCPTAQSISQTPPQLP